MSITNSIEHQLEEATDRIMDLEFSLSEAKRGRDELIVAARQAGMSLRRISDVCLVSHQTIANITERAAISNRDTGDEQAS